MKRLFTILITLSVALCLPAQDSTSIVKFGYLSYGEALKSMPEYLSVQSDLKNLRAQYNAELKRVESEFNRKYEDFLDGQKDFPKTILQKRQTELQELMTKNIRFKERSIKELEQVEQAAMEPLKARLTEVIARIAAERGYALVVNTDADACPYINPAMGEDINQSVKDALNTLKVVTE